MATMKDVARAAGVSHQTVSKVVNNRTDLVTESTRAKVEAAIERLGYAPNLMASRLRSGRSMSIGILAGAGFEDMGRFDLARLESGIGARVEKEGYYLTQMPQCGMWDNLGQVLKQGIVDGLIIFVYPHLGETFIEQTWPILEQAGVPVCALHFTGKKFPCLNVGYNIRRAGEMATQQLLKRGHERIACIGRGGPFGDEHWEGYEIAMKASGKQVEPRIGIEFMDATDGLMLGRKLLGKNWKYDACVFSRDSVAYGFLKACNEVGLRVPEDLALIGCDNLLTESYVIPELTTVDRKFEAHGAAAADLLFSELKGESNSKGFIKQILIEPEFIERNTSG